MATPTTSHRSLLTYEQAAAFLNVTERGLRALVFRREVPFTKVGRLVRFSPDELDEWVASRTIRPAS